MTRTNSYRMILLTAIIILVSLGIGHQFYLKRKMKTEYSKLIKAEIDGAITSLKAGNGLDYLTIDDSCRFEFVPIRAASNDNKSFMDIATLGDKVIKAKGSDSIKLISHGRAFIFRVRKF